MQSPGILIISPNALFIEALSHLVQNIGSQAVAHASTIEDGLVLLKEEVIDLVLVDHIESAQSKWALMDFLTTQLLSCTIVFFTRHHDQMLVCRCEATRYTQPDNLIRYILPPTTSTQDIIMGTKEKNELW